MTEETGATAADTGAAAITDEAAAAAAAAAAAQPPAWMADLPDELKADATLIRYSDVEALARGHVEAHKVAKSKVIVPGEGADDAAINAFFDAIGRPDSADKYDIPMPELPVDAGDDARAALAAEYQPFKELAHKVGLTPAQATAMGQFELDRQTAYFAKGKEEVAALKDELGRDYEPKRNAAMKIFKQLGFGDEFAEELDRKVGSARLLKGFMRLAEVAGEHGIVQSDQVEGFGEVKDAEAKLTELQADKSWRDRLKAGDAIVVAQQARLMKLAKDQAVRRSATVAE